MNTTKTMNTTQTTRTAHASSVVRASLRVERLRLRRSGLLFGLLAAFAFFGLSGPAFALYMPEILGAAAGSSQLNIQAAAATPADGLAMFNQSAMQLGLILAVAVAVTSLGWDSRAGSSIFYRTRVPRLGALTLPRLLIDCLAAVASYLIGLALAAVLTAFAIGAPSVSAVLAMGLASSLYLVLALSIGYLIMAALRRTAPAIAVSVVLLLLLPLLSQFPALADWVPTALLKVGAAGTEADLGGLTWAPIVAAMCVAVVCVLTGTLIAQRHTLRREA